MVIKAVKASRPREVAHKKPKAEIETPAGEKFDRAIAALRAAETRKKVDREKISIRLPVDVVKKWRATGPGWQTRMAEVLSAVIDR